MIGPSAPGDPHDLIPPPTHDRVDRYVQRWVAGTNGNLYVHLINKLPRYPIARWPGRPAPAEGALLLDIGCGWGRWMVAAARAGFTPVGIDIKVEALAAARRVLKQHGLRGYVVAADLMCLPFAGQTFDQIFSYSVIQHTHRRRAEACVRECARVLAPGGETLLEFPVSHGLTNFRHRWLPRDQDTFDSWCVRYYSWKELRALVEPLLGGSQIRMDCFFGIGVRPEDFDLLSWKYKPVVLFSEILRRTARLFPPLRYLSDSVFIESRKPHGDCSRPPIGNTGSNLDILPFLRCPATGSVLDPDPEQKGLIAREGGHRYQIEDEIPIMIPS